MQRTTFKGSQLDNIITRFYYKQQELFFQIILQREEEQVFHSEYNDYSQYRSTFQELLDAKDHNQDIYIQNNNNQLIQSA